jgi:parallel beta-helix repeat protein
MGTIGNHWRGAVLVRTGLLAASCIALLSILSDSAGAATGCDKVASTSGSDSNPGTLAAPYRTVQHLADSLSPGQTGCLRAGFFDSDQQIKVTGPGITLTSYPGELATVKGRWWIARGADGVTVSDLNLDGRSTESGGIGPVINAANTTFNNDDVTNYHTEICFLLGSDGYGRASGTVIENSRIHDCGVLPAKNGDHGIYIEASDNAVIRNNWIYDNADRGIQLYPDAQGTQIYGNVIDGNGEGVIFSSGDNNASSNNVIEHNVISNSNQRWNVESYWGTGPVGTGNVARDNCLFATNSDRYYNQDGGVEVDESDSERGFAAYGNLVADPQFVNREAKDFRLKSGVCASLLAGAIVTLTPRSNNVVSGRPVTLHGQVSPPNGTRVTIQILRHGHWRKFATTRLRPSGKFALHRSLRVRRRTLRARLRAMVPNVGTSRPVTLRVHS